MQAKWRATRLDINYASGGEEVPVAQFALSESAVAEEYSETTNGGQGAWVVRVLLTDSLGAPASYSEGVEVPFRVLLESEVGLEAGETYATRGDSQDWDITSNPNVNVEKDSFVVNIPAGETEGSILVWLFDDGSPGGPEDIEKFGFQLVASSVGDDSVTYTLRNATIGAQDTHIITMSDDDFATGDPVVFALGFHLDTNDIDPVYYATVDEPVGAGATGPLFFRMGCSSTRPLTGTVDADWAAEISYKSPGDGGDPASLTTAVYGVDYTSTLPEDFALPVGAGKDFRDFPFTLLGDGVIDGDVILSCIIDTPGADIEIGTPDVGSVTIADSDVADPPVTGVLWLQGPNGENATNGNIVPMPENVPGPVSYTVTFKSETNAEYHDGFSVPFTFQNIGTDGSDYTFDPPSQTLDFAGESSAGAGDADTVKVIRITPVDDGQAEGDELFRVRILAPTGVDPADTITVDPVDVAVLTNISDPPTGGGGDDGNMLDYTGARLIDERTTPDFSNPHMRLYPKGSIVPPAGTVGEAIFFHFIPAGVQIPKIDNALAFYTTGDWIDCEDTFENVEYAAQVGAIPIAAKLAEHFWYELYGPGTAENHARPSAVPKGTDLDPVRIEVVSSANIGTDDGQYTQWNYDGYWYEPQRSTGLTWAVSFFSVSPGDTASKLNADTRWDQVDATNRAIRDICFYGDLTNGYTRPPTMRSIHINAGGNPDAWVDNIRFEHISIAPSQQNGNQSMNIRIVGGGSQHTGDGQYGIVGQQGKIKLYDVQMVPWIPDDGSSDAYWASANGNLSADWGSARCLRTAAACWDIRHPKSPLPYPFSWINYEHELYTEAPQGEGAAALLGIDPNDGVTAVAANKFLNLWSGGAFPPWAPAAVAGQKYGPRNTYLQFVGRPLYLGADESTPDATEGPSGTLVVRNCDLSHLGSNRFNSSPSQAISAWSSIGTIYLSELTLPSPSGPQTTKRGGLLYLWQDGVIAEDYGPDGRWRQKSADGRYYCADRVVIEDITVPPLAGGVNDNKSLIKLGGVRELVFAGEFDFTGYTREHLQIGDNESQPRDNMPAILNLAYLAAGVHDGADDFSSYAGWGGNPRVMFQAFWSHFFAADRDVGQLTVEDVDNLQTIFTELQTTRLTDPSITPTWTTAFSPNPFKPVKPAVKWDAPASGAYFPEDLPTGTPSQVLDVLICRPDGTVPASPGTSSALTLRGKVTTITGAKIKVADQVFWSDNWSGGLKGDNTYTDLPEGSGVDWTYTLLPVGGLVVDGASAHVLTDKFTPFDGIWDGNYDRARFLLDMGGSAGTLSSGTKTLSLDLDTHTSGVSQLEYPPDSGTDENLVVSGATSVTVNVVPRFDYPSIGFQTIGPLTPSPGVIPAGGIDLARVSREVWDGSGPNLDALRLTSVIRWNLVTNRADAVVITVEIDGNGNFVQWDPLADPQDPFDGPARNASLVSAKNASDQDIVWQDGDWLFVNLQYFADDPANVATAIPRGSENQAISGIFQITWESAVETWGWTSGNQSQDEDDPTPAVFNALVSGLPTGGDTVVVNLEGGATLNTDYTVVAQAGQVLDAGASPPTVTVTVDPGDVVFDIHLVPIDQTGTTQGAQVVDLRLASSVNHAIGDDLRQFTINDLDTFFPDDSNTGIAALGYTVAADLWDTGGTWDFTQNSIYGVGGWMTSHAKGSNGARPNAGFSVGTGQWAGWTIVEDMRLGVVKINTSRVRFVGCQISNGNGGDYGIESANYGEEGDIVFEFCTIKEHAEKCILGAANSTLGYGLYFYRCRVSDSGTDLFHNGKAMDLRIVECYLSEPAGYGSAEAHADMVQFVAGRTLEMLRTRVEIPINQPGSKSNACSILSTESASEATELLRIEGCWLNGGNNTSYFAAKANNDQTLGGDINEVIYKDNHIGGDVRFGIWSWKEEDTFQILTYTITGNRWDTNPATTQRNPQYWDGSQWQDARGRLISTAADGEEHRLEADDFDTTGNYIGDIGYTQT